MTDPSFSFLALGDSYTIGEGVAIRESFPYQTVRILRKAGKTFSDPEIVARTGWTTDELEHGIAATNFLPGYDFVSLLIGVNDQYRGRAAVDYEGGFGRLLLEAIWFAGDRPDRVFVLSIPDWGVTPFAYTHLPDTLGRDPGMIAREIDAFNTVAQRIAREKGVDFIDITSHTRESASAKPSMAGWLAADQLHPSGREYCFWAEQLSIRIAGRI